MPRREPFSFSLPRFPTLKTKKKMLEAITAIHRQDTSTASSSPPLPKKESKNVVFFFFFNPEKERKHTKQNLIPAIGLEYLWGFGEGGGGTKNGKEKKRISHSTKHEKYKSKTHVKNRVDLIHKFRFGNHHCWIKTYEKTTKLC